MDLSIIIPVYNEEDNVRPLYDAIVRSLDPEPLDFEILYVDDGSTDATFARARELAQGDRRVRVIKLRRNYGQTPAMAAGIDLARGETLVTMDGDLQNDPADIPRMLEKIREGFDIVVGWRKNRHDKLLTRVLPSKMANWLIARVTGVRINDSGCSLRAYRAALIKSMPLYSEMHRFVPAITSLAGARISQLEVRHHARKYGKSKYGISRLYKVFFDLLGIKTILILAAQPLFSFTWAAVLAAFLGIFLFLYNVSQFFLIRGDFSGILLGMSILFEALAVFLVSLGLLGQLVYRTGNLKVEDFSILSANLARGSNDRAGADGA